jgi:hypothetical protein
VTAHLVPAELVAIWKRIPANVAGGFAQFTPSAKITSLEKAADGGYRPACVRAEHHVQRPFVERHNSGSCLSLGLPLCAIMGEDSMADWSAVYSQANG